MDAKQWADLIVEACAAEGRGDAELRAFLLSPILTRTVTPQQKEEMLAISEVLIRLFFRKAATGETFGPLEKMLPKFGVTLEEKYRLAEGPFINLARTYWTYAEEISDLPPEMQHYVIANILAYVDLFVQSRFFPTHNSVKMSVRKRAGAQRALLRQYATGIDVERFLSESPVLKEEAAVGQYFTWAILIVIAVGSLAIYLLSRR